MYGTILVSVGPISELQFLEATSLSSGVGFLIAETNLDGIILLDRTYGTDEYPGRGLARDIVRVTEGRDVASPGRAIIPYNSP